MMIGPEPMMRIFLMSVRFGILLYEPVLDLPPPARKSRNIPQTCHPERREGSAVRPFSENHPSARSAHAGFLSLISAIFFSRRLDLICFSRVIAYRTSENDST